MKEFDVIVSKDITENISWWGFSQWYKWRWNGTHIDLGPISIYELKKKHIWEVVAFLIWPFRLFYHSFYSGGLKNYMKGCNGPN